MLSVNYLSREMKFTSFYSSKPRVKGRNQGKGYLERGRGVRSEDLKDGDLEVKI